MRGANATKQSKLPLRPDGLLRGACHRARIRATRWLATTVGWFTAVLPSFELNFQMASPTATRAYRAARMRRRGWYNQQAVGWVEPLRNPSPCRATLTNNGEGPCRCDGYRCAPPILRAEFQMASRLTKLARMARREGGGVGVSLLETEPNPRRPGQASECERRSGTHSHRRERLRESR